MINGNGIDAIIDGVASLLINAGINASSLAFFPPSHQRLHSPLTKLPPPLSLQVTITPSHPTKVIRHKLTAQSPRRRSSCLTCRTDSGCQIKLSSPPFSLPHAGAYSPALPRRPSGTRAPRVRLAKDSPRSSVCNLMLTCPMSSAPGVVPQRPALPCETHLCS